MEQVTLVPARRPVSGALRRGRLLLATIACAALPAFAQQAASPAAPATGGAPPFTCAHAQGIERQMCAECSHLDPFRRIGCEQRVYWTTCRGKRWFNDPFCQTTRGPVASQP